MSLCDIFICHHDVVLNASTDMAGWRMVPRKSWVSEKFCPISESRRRFYQGSFVFSCLVQKSFESRARIFKQGSPRLGESRILPFATPTWPFCLTNCPMPNAHPSATANLVSMSFYCVQCLLISAELLTVPPSPMLIPMFECITPTHFIALMLAVYCTMFIQPCPFLWL